jgi:hypothetical protein
MLVVTDLQSLSCQLQQQPQPSHGNSLHFQIEHFTLCLGSTGDQELFQKRQNIIEDISELSLNFLSLFLSHLLLLLSTFRLLLNTGDDPP